MKNEAGIRELKAHLSAYLRRVKAGETIVITEHGRPVGRIVPASAPLEEEMEALVQAGVVGWSGQRLAAIGPVVRVKGDKDISDLLLEDRD